MNPIAVCLLAFLSAALGQPAPDGPPSRPGPVAEAAGADAELEALTGAFRNLYESLRAKGVIE